MAAIAIGAAWLSAGRAPFADAVSGALAPSDLPTDFVIAARRARGERAGTDIVTGNDEARAAGAPAFVPVGAPYRAHPPPAVMMVRPLVGLGFRGAAMVWLALSVLAVAVLAWIVTGVFVPETDRRFARVWPVFAALLLWPPVLHNFEKGQWSVPIAALLALSWVASGRGGTGRAGALIAAAGCFKITPGVVLAGLLAGPRRVRALAGAMAGATVLALASALVMGPDYWVDFLGASGMNTAGWQTAPANTMSLWGVLSRLLIGGTFANAAVVSPLAARLLWIILALALIGTASAVTWREARSAPGDPSARAFAAWSALAAILGPLAWTHTATWLILPGALLLRESLDASPQGDHVPGRLGVLLAAFALLTIPRLRLFAMAGALPVAPLRGLALGLHLLGALLVFAVACAPAMRPGVRRGSAR